jgi:superfamily II DNA or RNA helicase
MNNSNIRDNYRRGTVGDFLKDNLEPSCKIDVVSAYFTVDAYHKLKQEVDKIESMRFLFGEPKFIKELNPAQKNLKGHKIEFDRAEELSKITIETRLTQKKIAKDCYDWIEAKAEVKSMVKPNFLHGKMYHIEQKNGNQEAIVGSSNFTSGGLGLGGRRNIELNLVVDSKRDTAELKNWFEDIWNENDDIVRDVKEDVLRYLSLLYAENSPDFIYHKTLFHIFDTFLDSQNEKDFELSQNLLDSQIWNSLYEFQKDGVKGALNRIKRNGGCIIADSVGLGKTYEALAIIKEFELRNKEVLVICPKKLSANWELFQASKMHSFNPFSKDKFRYNILYHTDMGRSSGRSKADNLEFETFNWSAYDLVVIDESHNFRGNPKHKTDKDGNQKFNRAAWLMEKIIKQGAKTNVLLLSATPVNTTFTDLRNQISLITHGDMNAFYDSNGVKDIELLLKNTQKQFANWAEIKGDEKLKVRNLSERIDSSFFKLLDELSIARSRKHIIKNYSEAEIGKFPERLKPKSAYSPIDSQNMFPDYDKIDKKISEYKLSIYNPSKYLKDNADSKYNDSENPNFTQKQRESFLIGMMKMNFLKRLESSINSFTITLGRTIKKIEDLQKKIEDFQAKKSVSDDYDLDEDLPEDEQDEENEDWRLVGKKLKFDLEDLRLDEWLLDLESDKDSLSSLYGTAKLVDLKRDAKLAKLKEIIFQKQSEPINSNNKKALVFTTFSDTATYLYNGLKKFAKDNNFNIALVTGDKNETTFGKNDFESILTNFSPVSKMRKKTEDEEGEIDVLIATDCISEGQNLQDCDTVINYDIHWNPVRIIQRFGRIDRLKTKNGKIQLINFWPCEDLDNYINLKTRVEARMGLINLTASGDEDLLENPHLQENELKFREKQLLQLKDEILDIEELDNSLTFADFSLEDFRAQLLNYIADKRDALENAPLGMYALVPSSTETNEREFSEVEKDIIKSGVIFCLKQKNEYVAGKKLNPIAPYFLVYIRQDGTIRYNYVGVKQILDIYHALCFGVKEPYQKLCDLFNDETNNGENMKVYADLAQKAIKEIALTHNKQGAARLTFDRHAVIAPLEKQIHDEESFELITWLIIK